ncbi:hypothetical protein GCM10025734_48140 [Kitasatospora paranensis]
MHWVRVARSPPTPDPSGPYPREQVVDPCFPFTVPAGDLGAAVVRRPLEELPAAGDLAFVPDEPLDRVEQVGGGVGAEVGELDVAHEHVGLAAVLLAARRPEGEVPGGAADGGGQVGQDGREALQQVGAGGRRAGAVRDLAPVEFGPQDVEPALEQTAQVREVGLLFLRVPPECAELVEAQPADVARVHPPPAVVLRPVPVGPYVSTPGRRRRFPSGGGATPPGRPPASCHAGAPGGPTDSVPPRRGGAHRPAPERTPGEAPWLVRQLQPVG